MVMIMKSPPQYVQGPGELANIGQYAKRLGSKFLVICTPHTRARIENIVTESLKAAEKDVVFCTFSGKSTKDEVVRVQAEAEAAECNVVIGAGGGKAVDVAKAVADNLNQPVVIVPTVASNDAPCTGLSVLYNDQGEVIKVQFTKRNPDLVLADTAILAKAPARLFAAGIGDALATWFETRACRASGAKTLARGTCSETLEVLSRLCYDILMRDGVQAMIDVKRGEISQAVENTVEATIYLSGLGSESGGLAAAHAVNDSLVYISPIKNMYHGERVAFGILVQLVLEKAPEFQDVLRFLKATGLPTTLADMGASNPTEEELRKTAEVACSPKQLTKNMPFSITAEEMYAAILEADRLGRECG